MASRHLIIGSSSGYSKNQIDLFVVSALMQTSAELWLLIDEKDRQICEWLSAFDRIKVLPTSFKEGARASAVYRFFRILDCLQSCDHDLVVISDMRDVVFQSDPFNRLNGTFMAAGERLLINQSKYNINWIHRFFGASCLRRLSSERILCVGVMGGGLSKVKLVLQQLCEQMQNAIAALGPSADIGIWGLDQSAYNKVMYELLGPKWFEVSLPNDGLFFNMGDEARVAVLKSGLVLNDSSVPPSVLHQYDRIPGLEKLLRRLLSFEELDA